MKIDILTLFPGICEGAFGESILARASRSGLVEFRSINIRDFAPGRHRITDDTPYGGGQGMVMKVEPIHAAVEALRTPDSKVFLLSPSGRVFNQAMAVEMAKIPHVILISGHYEGVDQRVADHIADGEISIGDYILTNGTIAAVVVADAIARLIPGVLGDECSAAEDSFSNGLLEFPHYTRPPYFNGWQVPDILLSGNHAAIAQWRGEQSIARTKTRRPDLTQTPPPSATFQVAVHGV